MENQSQTKVTIKNVYLYLVSFVTLIMMVVSAAGIIDVALRTWIFPKADRAYYYGPVVCAPGESPTTTPDAGKYREPCVTQEQSDLQKQRDEEMRSAEKQRSLVRNISMLLVAAPLFAYHWRIIRRKDEV